MSSDPENKRKKQYIPMTGIEVMNDLKIDAIKIFWLVREGLLLPIYPTDPMRIKLEMSSRSEQPEFYLSRWVYRKSDVEEFKLKHKDCLEELWQEKAASQKQGPPDSAYFGKIGKKGGKKSKINRPILDALTKYMEESPKIHGLTNGHIAKNFCKKYKEDNAMIVTVDDREWEIYCAGEHIYSSLYTSHGRKPQNIEKSITLNTFRNNYIPTAKNIFFARFL